MSRPAQSFGRAALLRLALAGMLAAAAASGSLPAAAGDVPAKVDVVVDQAKVMRISRPADIVIIGNPAIADATIQDAQTLIITGHSFGTTNLIVLDSSGLAIADVMLTVEPQNDQVVTVYRRFARQTFSCAPDCSPVLAVGDDTTAFSNVSAQIQQHNSGSSSATSVAPK